MRWLMPKNWGRLASIQTVPHEPFDLEDGGLYDPANIAPAGIDSRLPRARRSTMARRGGGSNKARDADRGKLF